MGETTSIGWTNATWNPWMGCSRLSPGCDNCYMFTGMRQYGRDPEIVQRTAKPTFNAPLRYKEPKLIFTCSWSDFFHKQADEWREDAWRIILDTPQHTYQILTKRPGLAVAWSKTHPFPDNVWIGTSVESQKYAPRIEVLLRIPAMAYFVSIEPLLGSVDLTKWLPCPDCAHDCFCDGYECPGHRCYSCDETTYRHQPEGLDWVIAGGESGTGRRPADPEWLRSLRDQCQDAGVPFFFKQGNAFAPGQDRVLDGRTWDEMPQQREGD